MNLGTLDLSMLPPAALWALVCIVLVCHVLPDALSLAPKRTTSPLPSMGGTNSPAPSTASPNSTGSLE